MSSLKHIYAMFAALILPSIVVGASITCPNVEDLNPCSCKRVAFGLNVVCANFNDSRALLRAFRIIRDFKVHTVLLHGVYLEKQLPSDLFDGMKIQEIKIEKSLLNFSEPAFSGLDGSLHVLNVAQQSLIESSSRMNSVTKHYGKFSIAKLTNLNVLNVQFNKIDCVDNSWLNDKLPNVQSVVFDNNDIKELEDYAFASLKELKSLSLAENHIKKVSRSMFPSSADHLIKIDMSFNKISHLPSDFFSNMPSLNEVILSGNDLTTLPQSTWEPVWGTLQRLLLFENKIVCNETLNWIHEMRQPSRFTGTCYDERTNRQGRQIKDVYRP